MASINYTHALNIHSALGPQIALPIILQATPAASLLDVGCGTGVWLKAAQELGIKDVFGVDGVAIPSANLVFPPALFRVQDLTLPWNLGRKFDVVLCLEVGEHLDGSHAGTLVESLVSHADTVVFSAACPQQEGQHHINCQWPEYWQRLFNERGFVCSDELRDIIWSHPQIEPWYRQNIFIARRAEAGLAGQEPRLRGKIHPDMLPYIVNRCHNDKLVLIQNGHMPMGWYFKLPLRALRGRLTGR